LCDIAKFSKLVGYYDADENNSSIRRHLTRLQKYASIGGWDNTTKIAVVTSTVKGRVFDFLVKTDWSEHTVLSKALIAKFDAIDTVSFLNTQLFSLRQQSLSIREFAVKLTKS
jgi:hypothetical protein